MANGEPGQSIEQLQERYQKLHTRQIQAAANLENATQRLEELKNDAREQYGTDDLDELKARLAEMNAENERKRREYQAQLDKIESDLTNVEASFQADDSGTERTS